MYNCITMIIYICICNENIITNPIIQFHPLFSIPIWGFPNNHGDSQDVLSENPMVSSNCRAAMQKS